MLKEIINNMDVVKELDEYGKNKLASLMEGLLIVLTSLRNQDVMSSLRCGGSQRVQNTGHFTRT